MRLKPRNPLPFILFALAALAMASCQAPAIVQAGVVGGEIGIMYLTKDGEPPPADTEHQIPEHEDWCYETMGNAECFSKPQDTEADRLINVDPQNRYPLTRGQYYQDVAAANTTVTSTTTVATAPVAVVGGAPVASGSSMPGGSILGAPVTSETTTVITTQNNEASRTNPVLNPKKKKTTTTTLTTTAPATDATVVPSVDTTPPVIVTPPPLPDSAPTPLTP